MPKFRKKAGHGPEPMTASPSDLRATLAQIIEQVLHGFEWHAGKRPSIAELEAMLNSPEVPRISLLPDGSITAGEPREAALKAANEICAYLGRLEAGPAEPPVGALPERETWWLIERRVRPPQYICGHTDDLTPDPWCARRFATGREAHEHWRLLTAWRDECFVIQHMFINKPEGSAEPTRDTSGWRDGYDAALRGDTNRVGCYEREFYPLSNFSSFQIGAYKTAEHLYHSHKFTSVIKDGEVIWPGRYDILDAVQYAPSAHEAFKIAERHKKDRRPDWDAVKLDVMRRILREKATQHEYVRRKLMETGDREIVEDSWRDDYWGLGPNGDGQNWLGKLWMEVRAELRALPPSPQGQTP